MRDRGTCPPREERALRGTCTGWITMWALRVGRLAVTFSKRHMQRILDRLPEEGQVAAVRPLAERYVHLRRSPMPSPPTGRWKCSRSVSSPPTGRSQRFAGESSSECGILRVRELGSLCGGLEGPRERVPVAFLLDLAVVLPDRLDVLPAALGREVLHVAVPVRRASPAEDARRDVLRESGALAGPMQDLERPSTMEGDTGVLLEEVLPRPVRRDVPTQHADRVLRDERLDERAGLPLPLPRDVRVLGVEDDQRERDRHQVAWPQEGVALHQHKRELAQIPSTLEVLLERVPFLVRERPRLLGRLRLRDRQAKRFVLLVADLPESQPPVQRRTNRYPRVRDVPLHQHRLVVRVDVRGRRILALEPSLQVRDVGPVAVQRFLRDVARLASDERAEGRLLVDGLRGHATSRLPSEEPSELTHPARPKSRSSACSVLASSPRGFGPSEGGRTQVSWSAQCPRVFPSSRAWLRWTPRTIMASAACTTGALTIRAPFAPRRRSPRGRRALRPPRGAGARGPRA